MSGRPLKENAFLDDPAAYPEFDVLVQRQGLQHRFRYTLHRYRTAALIALAACSVSLSGAVAPSPSWRDMFACDGDQTESTISDWVAYLDKGLALDLLRRHFEGIASAAMCMLIMISIVLLVYPLQWLASRAATTVGGPISIPIFSTLAVGVPCAFACGVALWAEGKYRWGFASGVTVGLMCANLILKVVSFVQTSCGLSTAGKGHFDTQTIEENRSCLDFSEFVYFIVAAPSLLCEPRFLKRQARRSPRFARAITEFFHAALTYLATHAAFSALYAPAMRVIAIATADTETPGKLAESMWVDPAGWEALPVHGRGGWFCTAVEAFDRGHIEQDPGMLGCNTSPAWLQTTLAATLAMVILSPMAHFVVFYGFWHCVCLGCAELWGYPDRHFYGPWWLLIDEPRGFFRLWSTPVHRWLSTCIYVPIVSFRINASPATRKAEPPTISSAGEGIEFSYKAGVTNNDVPTGDPPVSTRVNCNGDGINTAAIENKIGAYVVGQRRSGDLESEDGQGGQQCPPFFSVRRLLALCCVFTFSSVVHEAVLFIAMRRTCWPIHSFSLMMPVVVIYRWDQMYHLQYLIPCKRTIATPSVEVTGGAESLESADLTPTRSVGNEWRGWGAVIYYAGSSLPMGVAIDFLSWQWWRVPDGRVCCLKLLRLVSFMWRQNLFPIDENIRRGVISARFLSRLLQGLRVHLFFRGGESQASGGDWALLCFGRIMFPPICLLVEFLLWKKQRVK